MSDTPRGLGWWQASDDKWYPPPRPDTDVWPTETASGGTRSAATGAAATGSAADPGPADPVAPARHVVGDLRDADPSPYGDGPPAGPPPATQQNRTPLMVVLGVLVVLAIVGLVVLISDDDPPTPTAASSTTAATRSGSGTSAPGTGDDAALPDLGEPTEGGLEVVDQGFSVSLDTGGLPHLSYGFLVENTTDKRAGAASATVEFLDASGTVIFSDDSLSLTIKPGETLGVGATQTLPDGGEPAEMRVGEFNVIAWDDPENVPEGELTVSDVSMTRDAQYGWPIISFTTENSYDEDPFMFPYALILFRNSAGDIIGASEEGGELSLPPPHGSSTSEITVSWPIDDIDPTRIAVYVSG